jgi:cardiolipin synthase A/B
MAFEGPPAPPTDEFARLIEALTQAPLRAGNRVTVLRNGCEIFPAFLEAIAAAQETISLSTYIWWEGKAAGQMAEALADRARDRLEVRVLFDAWGSAKVDRSVLHGLEDAGAEVAWFRPPHW